MCEGRGRVRGLSRSRTSPCCCQPPCLRGQEEVLSLIWPNLRGDSTQGSKVIRVYRAGQWECGACLGTPIPN